MKPKNSAQAPQYKCSFCGASSLECEILVAGPNGVFICDECIETCRDILGHARSGTMPEGSFKVTE